MGSSARRFHAAADALGLTLDVRTFPAGTRTAADAAAAIGCELAQIVKSLVFVAASGPVLALTSGANRVNLATLAAVCGVDDVRPASADEVRAHTGYAIGGTPPFGHTHPLEVVADADLAGHDVVWAAAGTPTTVFAISPTTLLAVTGARVATIAARTTP